jgi:hypothetical protein
VMERPGTGVDPQVIFLMEPQGSGFELHQLRSRQIRRAGFATQAVTMTMRVPGAGRAPLGAIGDPTQTPYDECEELGAPDQEVPRYERRSPSQARAAQLFLCPRPG